MSLRSLYQLPAYYFTLLLFGLGGLELCLLSWLTGWLPATERTERFFQRLIHRHFALFHWWCDCARLVHVSYHGLDRPPPGRGLLPFKPGFVLIARRARVPIQLVHITTDSDVLTKGGRWWRLPRFPAQVKVTAGPLIPTDTAASTTELSDTIETWFRSHIAPAPNAEPPPAHARGCSPTLPELTGEYRTRHQ
jgi:hypothetical protein